MTKILLIDDEPDMRELVTMRLEASGYEVLTAGDGQEGVELAREKRPDLIILDIMLPKMDGYQVCRILKFDLRTAKIPIILFSARVQENDKKMGAEVGADAYITKPFDPEPLMNKIAELLKAAKDNQKS